MKTRILIVEDDVSLATLLRDNLEYEGFDVDCVGDGREAVERARAVMPDLMLLDVMIPGLDGFAVCQTLTDGRHRPPTIMLTARGQQRDKIRGLELGADDYVTKPFSLNELLARIHAVLRRSQPTSQPVSLGDVVLDFAQLRGSKKGVDLALTTRECALLHYLVEHAGKVVTREELLRVVWGYDAVPVTRTVDNFVARLRRKIEPDPHHPQYIRTVHGDGYSLVFPPD